MKKAGRVKASWAARKAAVAEGKALNQNLPSWLCWDAQSAKVVPIPERVRVVQRIFKDYVAGQSIREVCRKLVADKVPPICKRANATWNFGYIHDILANRAVLGECLEQPDIWPVIVTETDFYTVAARLKKAHNLTGPEKARLTCSRALPYAASAASP